MKIAFVSEANKYASEQLDCLKTFIKQRVKRYQIESKERADVIFAHHTLSNQFTDRPVVVVERADSSTVGIARNSFDQKNVIGIIKWSLLRNGSDQNLPFVKRRYHATLLDEEYGWNSEREKMRILTEPELEKVQCLIPILERWNKKEWKVERPYVNGRDVNVVCIASLLKIDQLKKHRSDAIKICQGSSKILPRKKWLNLLARAKVCVCPWGYGEFCYRDVDAMLSGCVVVKPRSDFFNTWPDIYIDQKSYVACRPDFSDLETVCSEILSNYHEYRPIVEHNCSLLKNIDYEKMVCDFDFSMNRFGID